MFSRSAGTSSATATSQRHMKIEATEATAGSSPASIRRSMPSQVGLGGGEVLVVAEEQGDVDRDAGEDRLLDRRQALGCRGS